MVHPDFLLFMWLVKMILLKFAASNWYLSTKQWLNTVYLHYSQVSRSVCPLSQNYLNNISAKQPINILTFEAEASSIFSLCIITDVSFGSRALLVTLQHLCSFFSLHSQRWLEDMPVRWRTGCRPRAAKKKKNVGFRSDKRNLKRQHVAIGFQPAFSRKRKAFGDQTIWYLWSLKVQVDSWFAPLMRGHPDQRRPSFVANNSKQKKGKEISSDGGGVPTWIREGAVCNDTDFWVFLN